MIKVTLNRTVYNNRSVIIDNIVEACHNYRNFKSFNWYGNAQRDLLNLLSLYPQFTYPTLCAVCSALSPVSKWGENIKAVEHIILEQLGSNVDYQYVTYGANVAKARDIIKRPNGRDLISLFKAPKTRDFFLCLLDPWRTDCFVVDRHMLTIAGIKAKEFPTEKQYAFIVECYTEAASKAGVLMRGAELQAWFWSAFQFYEKNVSHY